MMSSIQPRFIQLLAIATWLAAIFRWESKKERTLLLFFTAINFAGLAVSMSRIAWVSALIACIFSIALMEERKIVFRKFIAIMVVLLIVISVLDFASGSNITHQFSNAAEQISSVSTKNIESFGSNRVYLYKRISRIIFENPKQALVGVGPDCLFLYNLTTEEDVKHYPEQGQVFALSAHSDPLEYASTLGIPALIFYICFVASIMLSALKNINSASLEMIGIFSACLGYLINCSFTITAMGIIGIFFVLLGILDKNEPESRQLVMSVTRKKVS
jgi:O-antigen ligase